MHTWWCTRKQNHMTTKLHGSRHNKHNNQRQSQAQAPTKIWDRAIMKTREADKERQININHILWQKATDWSRKLQQLTTMMSIPPRTNIKTQHRTKKLKQSKGGVWSNGVAKQASMWSILHKPPSWEKKINRNSSQSILQGPPQVCCWTFDNAMTTLGKQVALLWPTTEVPNKNNITNVPSLLSAGGDYIFSWNLSQMFPGCKPN